MIEHSPSTIKEPDEPAEILKQHQPAPLIAHYRRLIEASDGPAAPAEVIIDGVRYVPVSTSNPNAEHIAIGLITLFMGEGPWRKPWQELAAYLRVVVSDDGDFEEEPSVMDVVAMILKIADQNNAPSSENV